VGCVGDLAEIPNSDEYVERVKEENLPAVDAYTVTAG
jgi:hypothetical protein